MKTRTVKQLLSLMAAGVLAVAGSGCVTTDGYTMICFTPELTESIATPEAVLADLNAKLTYEVKGDDFACRRMGEEVLAWVVCEDATQRSAVKKAVSRSSHARLLSIGFFDPTDRDIFLLGPGASDTTL